MFLQRQTKIGFNDFYDKISVRICAHIYIFTSFVPLGSNLTWPVVRVKCLIQGKTDRVCELYTFCTVLAHVGYGMGEGVGCIPIGP